MGAHGEREGQSGGAGSPCSLRGDGLGCAGKAAGTPVLSAESPSGTSASQGSRRPPDDPTHPPGDPTRLRDAPSRAAPSSRRAGPHGCRTKPAGRRLRGPCISVSSAEHTLLPGACTARSPEPTPRRRGPPNPANLSVRVHVLCPSLSRRHLSRSNPPHTSLVSLVWWPRSAGWASSSPPVTLVPQRLEGAWRVVGSEKHLWKEGAKGDIQAAASNGLWGPVYALRKKPELGARENRFVHPPRPLPRTEPSGHSSAPQGPCSWLLGGTFNTSSAENDCLFLLFTY